MATIIETNNGFIAGDPPPDLPRGHHWCQACGGDGLEYDWTDEDGQDLAICGMCDGSCTLECTDHECTDHGDDGQGLPAPLATPQP